MKRAAKRRLHAGEPFERAIEREFPAFRTLQLDKVAFAHLGRQPRGGVAPELGLKLGVAVFHAVNIRPPRRTFKRSNLTSRIRKTHRDLSTPAVERTTGIRGRCAPSVVQGGGERAVDHPGRCESPYEKSDC